MSFFVSASMFIGCDTFSLCLIFLSVFENAASGEKEWVGISSFPTMNFSAEYVNPFKPSLHLKKNMNRAAVMQNKRTSPCLKGVIAPLATAIRNNVSVA